MGEKGDGVFLVEGKAYMMALRGETVNPASETRVLSGHCLKQRMEVVIYVQRWARKRRKRGGQSQQRK